MLRNLVGVGVLVVCLLCLSPTSSIAQPGSHLLNRVVSSWVFLPPSSWHFLLQAPYPLVPMRVLRGFKRQVSLADRGMMMGLGKRGVIGDRGKSQHITTRATSLTGLVRYDDGSRQEEHRCLGWLWHGILKLMDGERSLVFPSEYLVFVLNVLMINWDSFILIDFSCMISDIFINICYFCE